MAELPSTAILPADLTPEAAGEGSPEVKSKQRRKKQTSISSKRRIVKQDSDETEGRKTKSQDVATNLLSTAANPLSSTATNHLSTTTTTNPLSSAAANLTSATYEKDPVFLVMASGQIESAEIPDFDELYCNYTLVYGTDWSIISGLAEGITQTTRRSSGPCKNFVWNFPIEITFKSTNPYGWPQIVLSIYGLNSLERDEVRGYGSIHFPITPGSHSLEVPLFVPRSSSEILNFLSWLAGRKPEYLDPRFVAQGRGREVTRTASQGHVTVKLNMVTKDLWEHGYRNGSHHASRTQPSAN